MTAPPAPGSKPSPGSAPPVPGLGKEEPEASQEDDIPTDDGTTREDDAPIERERGNRDVERE